MREASTSAIFRWSLHAALLLRVVEPDSTSPFYRRAEVDIDFGHPTRAFGQIGTVLKYSAAEVSRDGNEIIVISEIVSSGSS